MKRSFAGFLVLGLVAFTGCGQGTPGGPGTDDAKAKKPLYGQANDTFNLAMPSLSTLHQGGTREGAVGIKRGTNFVEDVTLEFVDLPKGVTVDPATPIIKHGDKEATFTVKAEDDASLGDFTVKVKGHPTKGGDSSNELKLTVAKKDSFTLSVPLLSTSVKQGETKAVSIGIKRDKSFDQDVTLEFVDLPKGVTVDPASPVIKPEDKEAKLTLKAADDAALGDFALKVVGHPTKGADASHELKLSVGKKDSFTLSVPLLSTSVKQGETKAVAIGIKRGKSFDQDVTLEFVDLPKGVTVDPASPVIKPEDKEAKLTLKAADDAALGDFALKVVGHPTKGADASHELKLTVAKK